MRVIYAEYTPLTNSICITTFHNYILRIDCNKAEDGLKTALCPQNALNALAICLYYLIQNSSRISGAYLL